MKRHYLSLLSLLVIIAVASAAFLAIRFYLIEPESVALACASVNEGWRCALREWAVFGFLRNIFGMTALIAGSVLYTFELSGVGLLLGALVWVHRSSKNRESEQNASAAPAPST